MTTRITYPDARETLVASGGGTTLIRSRTADATIAAESGATTFKAPSGGYHRGLMFVAGTAGPAGRQGDPGEPGEPGPPSPDAYYAEVNFASATTTWTIPLPADVSSYATNVDTVSSGGDTIRGTVTRPNVSTIQIDWYYPTAGIARVYR